MVPGKICLQSQDLDKITSTVTTRTAIKHPIPSHQTNLPQLQWQRSQVSTSSRTPFCSLFLAPTGLEVQRYEDSLKARKCRLNARKPKKNA